MLSAGSISILVYITSHMRRSSRGERQQLSKLVDRYLQEIDAQAEVNANVAEYFEKYATRARNTIPVIFAALTWMGKGNIAYTFFVYCALFAFFGPYARQVISSIDENGKLLLAKKREKLLNSVRQGQ